MYTLSQLLFYNAKLMYRSIIVMDFLGFSIFDKKYKKKKVEMQPHQNSYIII